MLKWTVTKRSEANAKNVLPQDKLLLQQRQHARRSLGALSERLATVNTDSTVNGRSRNRKVRRSLGGPIREVCANYDKENQCITSTPHPAMGRSAGSPYSMALRDVSNITPNTTPCRLSNTTPQSRKRTLAVSPLSSGLKRKEHLESVRETYATTLPTFDIEYSPCGVKDVPFLALRGLGLTEFDKPGRYFPADEQEPSAKRIKTFTKPLPLVEDLPCHPTEDKLNPCLTPLSSRLSELRFNKINFKRPLAVGKTVNSLPQPAPPPPPPSSIEIMEDSELSLNSSEMGDLTLDKMIDAILESAKKDSRWTTPRPKRSLSVKSKQSKGSSPTYTPADDPAADLYLGLRCAPRLFRQEGETTIILEETASHINEREVKTPDSKQDQHCMAAKHTAKIDYVRQSLHKYVAASPLDAACHLRRQKAVRRKHKLEAVCNSAKQGTQGYELTLDDCQAGSPETPHMHCNQSKLSQLNVMQTPVREDHLRLGAENPSQQMMSANATPDIRSIDLQGTSTPTGGSIEKSRKCLTFSPTPSEDSIEKRRSVASSTNSRCSRTSTLTGSSIGAGAMRGTLELSVYLEQDRRLHVHVLRCKDLQRNTSTSSTGGSNAINAYVKVALINLGAPHTDVGFQRTTVHRNSSNPCYDQRFHFEIHPNDERRVQLAVWHRDREYKRSEFLGCMSFPIKHVTAPGINGTYRLQPQSCLTNPTTPILETMCENSQSSMEELMNAEDSSSAKATSTVTSTTVSLAAGATGGTIGNAGGEQISLSKKAIHQRDADENLFLRFLELDPSPDASQTIGTGGGGSQTTPATPRRSSVSAVSGPLKPMTGATSSGRTPFTITKRLARTGDRGFGFSIVWTHPPRVEKVETGLSADRAGILPGDYVVFVDKHNVVTMPEQDVLNLIRTQGNSLLLEIFRRPQSTGGLQLQNRTNGLRNLSAGQTLSSNLGGITNSTGNITLLNVSAGGGVLAQPDESEPFARTSPSPFGVARSSTACSNISIETAKRKLHLPQVTFSKESIVQQFPDDHRRKFLYQLISREQHFINAINFGIERFVNPLRERKDLISPNDHKILFQNIDELSRISEDILEQIIQDETEPQIHFASRVYLSKSTALCAAYRKYCNGLKKADCVLVNKSRNSNCDFMKFITEPPVPRKRPDLTTFIHRPLQHFREILKLVQMIASHCRVDSEEHNNFSSIISELQAAYREITVGGGLMEPIGEGRPLLTLQDLEARMVFTKCKPFQLASHGRQWIFGGDLSRVEGRSIKPYWTLLFSDILLFAKVSRDRVLFITEEPIALSTITDSCFNIRKKGTEFRITIDPNGRQIESPTVHCAPDLSRTPKKNSKKRYIVLRAPSTELKAVWQNLLTRQIFLVNATLGSTPLSSPLDSPDILQSFVPISDIGATATSASSVKVPSLDGIHLKNQQSRLSRVPKQVEELIDEKCRKLNKTGIPQGSALHLAQWMKGQLNKQIIESDPIDSEPEQLVEDWSVEQVNNRSKELNLVDADGSPYRSASHCNGTSNGIVGKNNGPASQPTTDDNSAFEDDDDNKSVSKSTTSDSQITVRSSPLSNKLDTISVCRQCHKNCKSRLNSPSSNSLTVQHSHSTPSNRCCLSNSTTGSSLNKSPNSTSSVSSSSTLTMRGRAAAQEADCASHITNAESAMCNRQASHVHVKQVGESERHLQLSANGNYKTMCQTPCHCKCTPKDFEKSTLSPDELLHERVKILDNVCEATTTNIIIQHAKDTSKMNGYPHSLKERVGEDTGGRDERQVVYNNNEDDDTEWSLMGLIGLAQINPAASLVHIDPFEALPTIAVVPPTPDALGNATYTRQVMPPSPWTTIERSQLQLAPSSLNSTHMTEGTLSDEYSPDNSPEDEIAEPPYRALNPGLKRYGTISSLERVPSEDTDDNKTYSSEEDSESDIKIVTKEVYDNNTQTFLNWTTRAGNFIEESRAFIDRYLGRRDNSTEEPEANGDDWEKTRVEKRPGEQHAASSGGDEEETIEGETSATSGEEVWGTPTSGGENDDMQIFGSIEQTHSSPTKSSSSYTGDDDTELMMDELLMAPPMTASAVRGLLPRRKLEPLFEEDSESAESDDDSKPLSGRDHQGQASEKNPPVYADLNDSTGTDSVSTTPSSTPQPERSETIKTTTPDENYGSVADRCYASVQLPSTVTPCASDTARFADKANVPIGLSPRLEMRLALNHDILGDEDLLTYSPGPDLTAILGRDLSTYHRMNGKDIIMNRIVTRVSSYMNIQAVATSTPVSKPTTVEPHSSATNQAMKNGMSSSYQQNNSKMDTPILHRRKATAPATWSSFGFADREERTLSDLERLARREKVYCMTQLNHNASQLKRVASFNTTTKHTSKLFNFLYRRNSENQLAGLLTSKDSTEDSATCHSDPSRLNSPRKETVKSLDRRFWRQLSKRRRASFHEELTTGAS
ncbi:uncharacterized protein LOC128714053 [Anopheles marshallii]|uniref:uncharacterized protein LOC128714053 n=1 Tax=Anopheles marshallii TaxID=1521116 RepID=UPI00237BE163|nr:uncharacterized protein LOC128714053 [Anopheles marshallii]